MAFNVTLIKNHHMKPREVAQRLEAQHSRGATNVKFVWLTDEVTAPHVKRRDLVKTRNRLLGREEQWVAAHRRTPPVAFQILATSCYWWISTLRRAGLGFAESSTGVNGSKYSASRNSRVRPTLGNVAIAVA